MTLFLNYCRKIQFLNININLLWKTWSCLIFNKSSLEHFAKFNHILQKHPLSYAKTKLFSFDKIYALCQSAIVVQVNVVALGPLVFEDCLLIEQLIRSVLWKHIKKTITNISCILLNIYKISLLDLWKIWKINSSWVVG